MAHLNRKNRIGLLCEVASGNLGNAAFEAAVVQHVRDYFPEAEIYGCCIDSLETLKIFDVRLFPLNLAVINTFLRPVVATPSHRQPLVPQPRSPLRPARLVRSGLKRLFRQISFWIASYKFMKGFQLLVICGGSQLSDFWGGPWKHPYTLFIWAALARLTATPLIVLGTGADRTSSPFSRWFFRFVLRSATYRSFRDENSKRIVEEWGVIGDNHVCPDLAFSLNVPRLVGNPDHTPRESKRVVGISPMAYCDPRVWPIKDSATYVHYLESLALLACNLIKQGWAVTLFASQTRMDRLAVRDLKALIGKGGAGVDLAGFVNEQSVETVDDLLSFLPTIDLVVATRMHGILLSLLAHTPALAISYDHKIDSLMAAFGLSEYCVDIQTIDAALLGEKLMALEAGREAIRDTLRRHVRAYRDVLERQYEVAFRPHATMPPPEYTALLPAVGRRDQ